MTLLLRPFATSGYEIANSGDFDGSAYMTQTFGSAGNRQKFVLAAYIKKDPLDADGYLIGNSADDAARFSAEKPYFILTNNSNGAVRANDVIPDSQWDHFIWSVDTPNGTNSDRVDVYKNGTEYTSFDITTYPSQNYSTGFFNNILHTLGSRGVSVPSQEFTGKMAEVYGIDGYNIQDGDLSPSDLYSSTKAVLYEGPFGTNGFHLDFKDNGDLGKDVSGNGNDWVNVLSSVAQSTDVPTF